LVYETPLVYTHVYFCKECDILQVGYICVKCGSLIRKNKKRLFKRENKEIKHWYSGIPVE